MVGYPCRLRLLFSQPNNLISIVGLNFQNFDPFIPSQGYTFRQKQGHEVQMKVHIKLSGSNISSQCMGWITNISLAPIL